MGFQVKKKKRLYKHYKQSQTKYKTNGYKAEKKNEFFFKICLQMTTLTTSDEYIVMIETIYLNSVWNEFIVIISYTGKASGSIVNYQFSLTLVGWLISWLVVKFRRFKFNSDGMSSFFLKLWLLQIKPEFAYYVIVIGDPFLADIQLCH